MDINASDFKARCLRILDEVARTGEPVTIRKRGRPVATLVPVAAHPAEDPLLALRGSIRVTGDILAPVVTPHESTFDAANIGPSERRPSERRRTRVRR